MPLYLHNTLTRKKEEFKPLTENKVGMYTCGPTVYNYAHIGNLRSYVFADVLRRAFEYFDYEVDQIMNITDIGHLASDADSGEDKMTKGLLREGKELTLENMREMAEFYAGKFNEDLAKLNILPPSGQYYASDYVKEDVELVSKLEEKGYAYKTSDGIYFDTAKMSDYGILWGGKRKSDKDHVRIDENSEKKNPEDFALWKFNDSIGYESPWGQGFPGWHIECSAMGMKFLGEQFDVHTGGIDHISIHHTNEIAQSECATGKKPFVRYWLHNDFVDVGGIKMAKSGDNFLTLQKISDRGIDPAAYRFWLLMASYRTKVNFNWEALEAAWVAFKRLLSIYRELGDEAGEVDKMYKEKFTERIGDDLDTPRAISLMWDLVKDDDVSDANKKATLLEFDKVLGLGFGDLKKEVAPAEVMDLVQARAQARNQKDFTLSDELRDKIKTLGWDVKDTAEGQKISKL